VNVVRLQDCPFVPWRNGGGRTRELLAWPSRDDWRVRVSVAEIEADGPFSSFDGIERAFAVLGGAGVVLSLPLGDVRLHAGDPALGFPGEAAPLCRLIDGPTRDLNLMVKRSAGRAVLRREPVGPAPWRGRFDGLAPWCGVFDGRVLHWTDDPHQPLPKALPKGDGVWWLALEAAR
jgi:environmental stress-induced protein Ves